MSEAIYLERLTGCARCDGEGHDQITFYPLTHPVDPSESGCDKQITHWAPCPTNGEPILMVVTEKEQESS